jgi:hypothetical protein
MKHIGELLHFEITYEELHMNLSSLNSPASHLRNYRVICVLCTAVTASGEFIMANNLHIFNVYRQVASKYKESYEHE